LCTILHKLHQQLINPSLTLKIIIIMKLLKTLLFLALFSISFTSCNDLEDDNNAQNLLITDTTDATGGEVDLPDGTKD
jgi:hypothetical protein